MRSSAIILLITAAALSGQSPLSVCDALQRLDELHGKRITIKARYRTGQEIANLYDPACPAPALVDGVKRPPPFTSQRTSAKPRTTASARCSPQRSTKKKPSS